MKKINTLYVVNRDTNLAENVVMKGNEWVFTSGIPTRKFDGTSCAIINGELFKRYDAKKGKKAPEGAIPCQEADPITGHHPHWVKCERTSPNDKFHFEAFDALEDKADGTYELCGEKVQKNPEKIKGHVLIRHGSEVLPLNDFSFEAIRDFLMTADIEGIVFHDSTGTERMCKIRKDHFGINR